MCPRHFKAVVCSWLVFTSVPAWAMGAPDCAGVAMALDYASSPSAVALEPRVAEALSDARERLADPAFLARARALAGDAPLTALLGVAGGPTRQQVDALLYSRLADVQLGNAASRTFVIEALREALLRNPTQPDLSVPALQSLLDGTRLSLVTHANAATMPIEIWRYLVRRVSEGRPDPRYEANQQNALRLFSQWFAAPGGVTYLNMMRAAHREALRVSDYVTGPAVLVEPASVPAGRLRQPSHYAVIVPFERSHQALLQRLGIDMLRDAVPSGRSSDPTALESRWTVAIDGIPADACPEFHAVSIRGRIELAKLVLPESGHVPLYATRMGEVMEQLRAIAPERTASDPTETARLVTLLARYHQLGVGAHLFEGVNNSVLMGQVNWVLSRHGLTPMSHGDLDYVALSTDTPRYTQHFLGTVRAAGTNASRLP